MIIHLIGIQLSQEVSVHVYLQSRHSIAHTKFKIRREKRNALLEIAMAEKNGNY